MFGKLPPPACLGLCKICDKPKIINHPPVITILMVCCIMLYNPPIMVGWQPGMPTSPDPGGLLCLGLLGLLGLRAAHELVVVFVATELASVPEGRTQALPGIQGRNGLGWSTQ